MLSSEEIMQLIQRQLDEIKELLKHHRGSTETNEIAVALALARMEIVGIKPNKKSIDGWFVDILQVMKETAAPLGKQSLALYQYTDYEDGSLMLYTKLIHKSGQSIGTKIKLILPATDKEVGAHIDFHKRHQALSLLGIYPDSEVHDDNGDLQAEKSKIKGYRSPLKAAPKVKHWETITKEQHEDLLITLENYPDMVTDLLEKYGIGSLMDMPKESFKDDMKNIRNIIKDIERR